MRRAMFQAARYLWILLLTGLAATPLAAQGLPTAWPREVGLSAGRLGRIRAVLQQDIDRGELPGAVALIARRGKAAYFETFGSQDIETGKPMPPDAIFRIASMTKPVTAVAVMILFEEGHFVLDDPVSRFIPELAKMEVIVEGTGDTVKGDTVKGDTVKTEPAASPITIRHLLSHTSGLTYSFFNRGPVGRLYREAGLWTPGSSLADFVSKLAELPLVHHPGTAWEYGVSNDVLGYLVEVITGESYDVFLEKRLFAPLGMTDTSFYVPEEKRGRLVTHYAVGEDGQLQPAPTGFNFHVSPALDSGGGGLVSTAADYARFLQMLLGGGKLDDVRILSRKSVELMTADHARGLPRTRVLGKHRGYGLGFAVSSELGRSGSPVSAGSYKWAGIFNTYFWVDPEEELFGLIMAQTSPFGHLNLGRRYEAIVYQAIDD